VYALIGLGNPGKRYIHTRHNIGYLIVDYFSAFSNIPFKAGKGDYYYRRIEVGGNDIFCVKPTTYMNRSGQAVRQVCDYYQLEPEKTLVICDDFNLPFGTLRYRSKGSDGGHNGLKSIIYHLQSDNFSRLRVGIGNPSTDTIDFVLNKFSKKETELLNELLPVCSDSIRSWLEVGIEKTMTIYNKNYITENGK
jgi:PTH1 family peptidyl-tRNA hydrolase